MLGCRWCRRALVLPLGAAMTGGRLRSCRRMTTYVSNLLWLPGMKLTCRRVVWTPLVTPRPSPTLLTLCCRWALLLRHCMPKSTSNLFDGRPTPHSPFLALVASHSCLVSCQPSLFGRNMPFLVPSGLLVALLDFLDDAGAPMH